MHSVSFHHSFCVHLLTRIIDRVRLLYDRSQSTARLVVKDRTDLEPPVVCYFIILKVSQSNLSPGHVSLLSTRYESNSHQM